MSINQQKTIWNRNWERQNQINPERILNSRFTQEAYRCLKSYIDESKDKLILEAGCGTGRLCCLLARDFPNLQVIGMDISPNSLKIANSLKEYLQLSNVSFETKRTFSNKSSRPSPIAYHILKSSPITLAILDIIS